MGPSSVLRAIAKLTDRADIAAQLDRLADALDQQHGRQNDQFQIALGMTDLDLRSVIDTNHEELREMLQSMSKRIGEVEGRVGELTTNAETMTARQDTMMEFLEELQQGLRRLQTRPPCMHPEQSGDGE